MCAFRKSSLSRYEVFDGQHRFEHWYRDNSIYFITEFKLIIVSLLNNHYHMLGYLKSGAILGPLMQRFHGSVAKLVNDTLETRLTPFWYDSGKQGYFDGCIRDELQLRRAYRYVANRCTRHHVHPNPETYPHIKTFVPIEPAVKRAHQHDAFLDDLPYKQYEKWKSKPRANR